MPSQTMKYLTREQMLLKLGPTEQRALTIFSQKEDFKFPVVDFGPDPYQTVKPGKVEPTRYVARVQYFPYAWSNRAREMVLEMAEEEYTNLPDDPEVKSLKGPGF